MSPFLNCHSWYSAGPRPLSRIDTPEWIAIESDMRRLIRAYLHCMTNAGSAITEPLFWCCSMLCGRSAVVFSVILTCFPHLLGWFLHICLGKDLLKQLKREALSKKKERTWIMIGQTFCLTQSRATRFFGSFLLSSWATSSFLPFFLLVWRVILPLFPPTLHRVNRKSLPF